MVQDIINGITGFFVQIGSGVLDFIISLIAFVINLVLAPINALISLLFPDLNNILINFKNTYSYVFTDLFGYIFSYIPPMTMTVFKTFLIIYISYYSVKYVYRGIILVPKLINKIKFW